MSDITLIAGIWLIIFPWILISVSETVSLVGVYHSLKEETLFWKTCKIIKCNIHISFFLLFTYYIVIKGTLTHIHGPLDQTQIDKLLTMVGFIALITILVMRIVANPSELTRPNLCKICKDKDDNQIVDQHKERIISFYYSFICASLLVLLITWSNGIIDGNWFEFHFDYTKKALQLIGYVSILIVTTTIGELILLYLKPIRTT